MFNVLKSTVTIPKKPAKAVGALFLLALLSACGVSSVNIQGNFPTPNVQKMPLTLAVLYDDALREFNYIEYTETGQEEFDIRSGESVIQLFNAVLPAMFDRVVFVDSMDEARSFGADDLFQPAIG